ncbi:transposase [Rhodanobacter ginsengiterrae]|uniref:transposase n=1 Tax=Rhodanobacter ginsengiterrae TaxID=2008451 RepID=UPI003CE89418
MQRGNNRPPCFLDDEDRQRHLQCLRPALLRFGCRLHACVLTSNHVHLLLTLDETGGVSRMMPTFARNHAGSFNGRHGRGGALWEGRFKACLVDSGRNFPSCSRCIELNPVRARMVAQPGAYPWSSHGANAQGRRHSLLAPHREFLGVGTDPAHRARRSSESDGSGSDPP